MEPSSLGVGTGANGQGDNASSISDCCLLYQGPDAQEKGIYKGYKQKGYVELLLSVSTGVCPNFSLS